jgi:hypothetical protein
VRWPGRLGHACTPPRVARACHRSEIPGTASASRTIARSPPGRADRSPASVRTLRAACVVRITTSTSNDSRDSASGDPPRTRAWLRAAATHERVKRLVSAALRPGGDHPAVSRMSPCLAARRPPGHAGPSGNRRRPPSRSLAATNREGSPARTLFCTTCRSRKGSADTRGRPSRAVLVAGVGDDGRRRVRVLTGSTSSHQAGAGSVPWEVSTSGRLEHLGECRKSARKELWWWPILDVSVIRSR